MATMNAKMKLDVIKARQIYTYIKREMNRCVGCNWMGCRGRGLVRSPSPTSIFDLLRRTSNKKEYTEQKVLKASKEKNRRNKN